MDEPKALDRFESVRLPQASDRYVLMTVSWIWMGNSKALMLPGGPLLPFNPAIHFFLGGKIHFPTAVYLWQSSGKVKKFSCG
jgi:hypothetical protein